MEKDMVIKIKDDLEKVGIQVKKKVEEGNKNFRKCIENTRGNLDRYELSHWM